MPISVPCRLCVGGVVFRSLGRVVFRYFAGIHLATSPPLACILRPPCTARSRVKRVVILGLDGLDHGLTEKMLAEGKLPNLARLREQGSFKPLASTLPPISPVAWSSFQTGVNPGKHNIFDFLMPDLRTYQPKLSSVEIRPPRRMLRLGNFRFPLGKADVRLLRKSKPFWSILSDYGIFNCIIRVPITFPPEKFAACSYRPCVSPICAAHRECSLITPPAPKAKGKRRAAKFIMSSRPATPFRPSWLDRPTRFAPKPGPLKLPFVVTIKGPGRAILKIGGVKHDLQTDKYTDWIQVGFHVMPGLTVHGVCKFLLLATEPEFELYATPINIDPEKPAMPVGYPSVYSVYLAKKQGSYATLGLAEDTWGLSEHVLGDDHFLQQCLDTDREREAMFFDGLDKIDRGLCVCVFDGTDRMQHMFWRYLDEQHPARPEEIPVKHRHAIEDLYQRMDGLVGRTMARCRNKDNLLMVISDHGFNSFRRGIDLNRWLEDNGYLKVDDKRRQEEHLGGIDWSQTRAFAIGLTGIFINIKDKFSQGIVAAGEEADNLREEIALRLATLIDPKTGKKGIKRVFQAVKAYRGPYKEQAPDLIVGYDRGYRVSWDAAIGRTSKDIFSDNVKAWSGDHCVDPSVVPGILFCNRPIESENPRLLDIGPTVLDLFGIEVPEYMDGKALTVGAAKI